MFKKFDGKESIVGVQQLKSSVQKGIRLKILEYYPELQPYINGILPKMENFQYKILQCDKHIEILVSSSGEPLFYKHREGVWFPTLKLLHKYPFMLACHQVDKVATKLVLNGENVACSGLTTAGAKLSADVPKNTVVAIMAEGKEHALAVGITAMSSKKILKNDGIGVGIKTVHYLNDGLWKMMPFKRMPSQTEAEPSEPDVSKNLVVHGMPEYDNDDIDDVQMRKTIKALSDKLGLSGIDYDEAIRLGKVKVANRVRAILVKCRSKRDKEKILQASSRLKGSNIFIAEDMTKDQLRAHKSLLEKRFELKQQHPRATFILRNDKLHVIISGQANRIFQYDPSKDEVFEINSDTDEQETI